ncbi:MAG: LptF/LptG family permease [Pseudomonadota bacterium]
MPRQGGGPRTPYRGPSRIDRYLFMLTLRPMIVGLGIALVALLTERLIRLLDLVTAESAPIAPLLAMLAALLPHYLGLALPAAFALGLLVALSGLSSSNELDALESAGWSVRRIAASFVLSGALLAVLSLVLSGFAQPHARYAYRDAKHTLVTAGWNGTLPEGQVVTLGDGLALSAARVGSAGQRLEEVFLVQTREAGETVTTAARGLILPDVDAGTMRLLLEDGISLTPRGILRFEELLVSHEIRDPDDAFRPRGELRERTLPELFAEMDDPASASELHARLARAFSLISIALAMVPLGLLRKRMAVWPRVIVALVGLTLYHHALLLAQELGAAGHAPPALTVWGTAALVFLLALWLYVTTPSQGTPSPLRRILRGLSQAGSPPGPRRRGRAEARRRGGAASPAER